MSLKARAVKVADEIKVRKFFDTRSILRKVIDSDLSLAKELVDLVDEWVSGGDISDGYPTINEMAVFLADDEIVGKHGGRSTFARWLKDAKQGKFDFKTTRAAIKSIEESRKSKVKRANPSKPVDRSRKQKTKVTNR